MRVVSSVPAPEDDDRRLEVHDLGACSVDNAHARSRDSSLAQRTRSTSSTAHRQVPLSRAG